MRLRILRCALSVLPLCSLQSQDPPLVDYHQHLFSPALIKLASAAIPPITAADVIALLDSAGIRRALVLSVAYMYGSPSRTVENEYERVKAENDWTSQQVAQYPDRLRGFCSFNPLKDYALAELARCTKDPQLHFGLKLHFGNSDVNLDSARHVELLRGVFHAANAYRMPIVVHMHANINNKRPYGRDEALVFLNQVLPAAPDVPVQIAHLAGAGGYDDATDQALAVFVEALANHDARAARLYFDVTGVVAAGISVDQANLVVKRIWQLGVDRVLYGSDAAAGGNPAPREGWAAFRKLPLSESELRTIANNVAPYMRWDR